MTVLPFDGSDSTLARRNARNIHHLLIEESGVNRLVDPTSAPVSSSRYDRLCEAAWSTFQQVEADGMVVALESGGVETAIDAAWSARLERLATRKEPVTGVSEFPTTHPAVIPGAGRRVPGRRTAPFETLRDAADRARSTGGSPAVHLAALELLADHLPVRPGSRILGRRRSRCDRWRCRWGGIPADAVAAFEQAGPSVVVLCSSDPVYAELAAPAATALKAAGADFVALAGRGANIATSWRRQASTPSSMSASTCWRRSPTCMNVWGCADGKCREARMVVLRARLVGLHRRWDRER